MDNSPGIAGGSSERRSCWSENDASRKSLCENLYRPRGTQIFFPLYPALRLPTPMRAKAARIGDPVRLRAGLSCPAPAGLVLRSSTIVATQTSSPHTAVQYCLTVNDYYSTTCRLLRGIFPDCPTAEPTTARDIGEDGGTFLPAGVKYYWKRHQLYRRGGVADRTD